MSLYALQVTFADEVTGAGAGTALGAGVIPFLSPFAYQHDQHDQHEVAAAAPPAVGASDPGAVGVSALINPINLQLLQQDNLFTPGTDAYAYSPQRGHIGYGHAPPNCVSCLYAATEKLSLGAIAASPIAEGLLKEEEDEGDFLYTGEGPAYTGPVPEKAKLEREVAALQKRLDVMKGELARVEGWKAAAMASLKEAEEGYASLSQRQSQEDEERLKQQGVDELLERLERVAKGRGVEPPSADDLAILDGLKVLMDLPPPRIPCPVGVLPAIHDKLGDATAAYVASMAADKRQVCLQLHVYAI